MQRELKSLMERMDHLQCQEEQVSGEGGERRMVPSYVSVSHTAYKATHTIQMRENRRPEAFAYFYFL